MWKTVVVLLVAGWCLGLYLQSVSRPPGQATTILLDGVCRPTEKAVVFVNAVEITVECEPATKAAP
jgi:hypothetical protein